MDLFRDDKTIQTRVVVSRVRIDRIRLVFRKKNKKKQIHRFNKILCR